MLREHTINYGPVWSRLLSKARLPLLASLCSLAIVTDPAIANPYTSYVAPSKQKTSEVNKAMNIDVKNFAGRISLLSHKFKKSTSTSNSKGYNGEGFNISVNATTGSPAYGHVNYSSGITYGYGNTAKQIVDVTFSEVIYKKYAPFVDIDIERSNGGNWNVTGAYSERQGPPFVSLDSSTNAQGSKAITLGESEVLQAQVNTELDEQASLDKRPVFLKSPFN
jgi:hypothetical protein